MNSIQETRTLLSLEEKTRLSDLPAGTFSTIRSRKAFKNAIKKGLVKLNSQRAYTADLVQGGETIEIFQDIEAVSKPSINIQLEVLFEDEYLAIINKPAGIEVSGNKKWNLENALNSNLAKSKRVDALTYPEPIHRLDYATSGVLMIGKTSEAVIELNQLFENRQVQKIYHAICIGEMKASGDIVSPIEDKACKSSFKILSTIKSEKYIFLNLVQLIPHTGRRHQLRIHMSEQGNPIFGDLKYAHEGLISKGNGLFLHASMLQFQHPLTKELLQIEKDLPKKFKKIFPNG